MTRKKVLMLLGSVCLALMLVVPAIAGCPAPTPTLSPTSHPRVEVAMYTSPLGSSAYQLGLAMEAISRKFHPWLRIYAVETLGGSASMKMLSSDPLKWEIDVSFNGAGETSLERQGLGAFEGFQTLDRRVLVKYCDAMPILLTFDPDIKSLADVRDKGKSLAMGTREQGIYGGVMAGNYMEYTFGIEPQYLDLSVAKNALLDGLADVALAGAILPEKGSDMPPSLTAPLIEILSSGRTVYFVDWGTPEQIVDWNKSYFTAESVCPPRVLPAGAIEGLTKDLQGFTSASCFSAMKDFPEELAYEFTKLCVEHLDLFPEYHALFKFFTPQYIQPSEPFFRELMHPGAVRAFKEAGFWKE